MTPHVRASLRALTALFLVAVALVGPGCRMVKPEAGGDRTVEAGVPVGFGSEARDAPVVRWDFGDGSPPQQGARVSHAFQRAGSFPVRALAKDKDEVLASATVTVVPRPVLRALPADTEVALFFPQLRGNVEPLVAFVSRLLGEAQARQTLEEAPLLSLVLGELRGQPRVVDPEEGMGFFSLPGFEGTVALLGVMDPQAAVDAVVKELESGGATVARREPDGTVHLRRENGAPMLLFLDRGYLYLVVPDIVESDGVREVRGQVVKVLAQAGGTEPAGEAALEAVRARIAGMSGTGLSELPLLTELRSKVGAGNLHLFARPEGDDASSGIHGIWAALKAEERRLDLEGWVASDKSLFEGRSAPGSELLGKAPLGPIASLMVSMPPEELAKLVFGAPGSARRERTQHRLQEEGLDAAGVEQLLGALRGDLTLLAYFDAAAFYRNFVKGSRRPEPRGALLFQAGLVRSEPVLEWLTARLKARGQPFEVVKGPDATRLRTRAMEQPVEFTVTADRLMMHGGESLEARPKGDVGAELRERFGAQAFEQGHFSAMVDMGRLRSELDAPQEVPGVPSQQLPVARSLVDTLLDQLPPVELVFADFAPEQGGGRFRARTVLRSR
ncbi:PKD domain-containing protein [Vitiosangium sp. GDMCC 1.1324]|uniref:PKD domain-containing protein n=1 Tax=Vitiosangium sp. (strain GDMCC 1.1324) TaxID=2138576 RepID=UPI000D3D7B35|nr:PKD domain-containing protein [Vitiosangium sp. GDMCC 1.1324]PTL77520.1 PKD domain-containing protein [Vitiosangium sp. GDMCC 1.1324]